MNNYHLFLIRSDSVTQIAAHLLAGIIALVFISSLVSPAPERLADVPVASRTAAAVILPAGTTMLAAAK